MRRVAMALFVAAGGAALAWPGVWPGTGALAQEQPQGQSMPGMETRTPDMHGPDMHGSDMPGAAAGTPEVAEAVAAYKAAMDRMMQGMMVPTTGNVDRDFTVGMIAHHQGAIEMAQIELRYGSDPELRQLAQGIVAAQEKEVAFMQAWLAKHPR